MDAITHVVFVLVYLGMVLGRIPGLALDRTGVALLGAIVLIATERVTAQQAWQAIHVPTIGLLFGLMVVSAQFRLAGLYSAITHRIAANDARPQRLLMLVIATAAGLSALLANDIVCLAMAPLLVEGCLRRGLRPLPFLLALACASNVGSAATLIGNPQNMLIGQTLRLSFAGYLLDSLLPSALGCIVVYAVIAWQFRTRWHDARRALSVSAPALDLWQACKGAAVLLAMVVCFLLVPYPREVAALAAAGLLLLSRRMHAREMLALVDWQLLVLFAGLFIVNHALAAGGSLEDAMNRMTHAGLDPRHPGWLFAVTVVLSNLVSNVPAVMLLLPAAHHPQSGPILALASTLAGNLIIVGSIANIIVADQAQRLGIAVGWREHARVGVPVTLATLAIAAAWLAIRMPRLGG